MIDYAEALTVIDVNSGSFIGRGKGARAGGHDHQDQPRGGRGGRQPAAPARHRRDHRDRLHRHGPRAQPRRRHEDAAQDARRGPHEDVHRRDLQARPGRDDPPERHRGRARDHEPAVPDMRGRGRDPLGGDDRDRVRAPAARRRRRTPGRRGVPACRSTRASAPSSPATARACCTRSRRRPASRSCSRAPKGSTLDHFAITFMGTRDGGRGARAAVPPGRRGARRDRRAAHVRRRRRGRQNRRLHHLDRGAAPYVGEKRMVRIDQVGRTAASALLLDESGEVVARPHAHPGARAPPGARRSRRAPALRSPARRVEARPPKRARGRATTPASEPTAAGARSSRR